MRRLLPIIFPFAVMWVIAGIFLPEWRKKTNHEDLVRAIDTMSPQLAAAVTCASRGKPLIVALYESWVGRTGKSDVAPCFDEFVAKGRYQRRTLSEDNQQFASYLPKLDEVLIALAEKAPPDELCGKVAALWQDMKQLHPQEPLGAAPICDVPGKPIDAFSLPTNARANIGHVWFLGNGRDPTINELSDGTWRVYRGQEGQPTAHPEWLYDTSNGLALFHRSGERTFRIPEMRGFIRWQAEGGWLYAIDVIDNLVFAVGPSSSHGPHAFTKGARIVGDGAGRIYELTVQQTFKTADDIKKAKRKCHDTKTCEKLLQREVMSVQTRWWRANGALGSEIDLLEVGGWLDGEPRMQTCASGERVWLYANRTIAHLVSTETSWTTSKRFINPDTSEAHFSCRNDKAVLILREQLQTTCQNDTCTLLTEITPEKAARVLVTFDWPHLEYLVLFPEKKVALRLADMFAEGRPQLVSQHPLDEVASGYLIGSLAFARD